jgi:hypothetical protein
MTRSFSKSQIDRDFTARGISGQNLDFEQLACQFPPMRRIRAGARFEHAKQAFDPREGTRFPSAWKRRPCTCTGSAMKRFGGASSQLHMSQGDEPIMMAHGSGTSFVNSLAQNPQVSLFRES